MVSMGSKKGEELMVSKASLSEISAWKDATDFEDSCEAEEAKRATAQQSSGSGDTEKGKGKAAGKAKGKTKKKAGKKATSE